MDSKGLEHMRRTKTKFMGKGGRVVLANIIYFEKKGDMGVHTPSQKEVKSMKKGE